MTMPYLKHKEIVLLETFPLGDLDSSLNRILQS